MMLREQVATFDADFIRREDRLDVAELLVAIRGVLSFSSLTDIGKTLVAAATATKVVENADDAKQVRLYHSLVNCCFMFLVVIGLAIEARLRRLYPRDCQIQCRSNLFLYSKGTCAII
jgi:hypothetical protein